MNKNLDVQTGFAEVNGARLYYEIAGQGQPLVLSHGLLGDKSMWDEQFATFAEQYQVIRFDLRGYGASSTITDTYTPYEDLRGLLDFLGIAKAYVLGLSASGATVIDFTLAYPERVSALIPVAAGLNGYESGEAESEEIPAIWQEYINARQQGDDARAAEMMLRYWIDGSKRPASEVDPTVRDRVRTMLLHNYSLANDPNAWNLTTSLEPPAAKRLSEIQVPTLVIYGDKDEDETQTVGELLATQIQSAQKMVIHGTTHHPNMEQPEKFNRAVLDFLATLS